MTQPASQETQVGREGLQFPLKGREARVPLVWLRDHCRCQACYNPDTFQKNADSYSLKGLSVVQSDVDGDALTVKWQDGHISKFSLQWIADNFYTAGPQAEDFLWDGSRMNNEVVPVTTFDSHMGTEEGLKKTLSNIVKFGFCIVDGAPATAEGTELVTGRISFVQETVYGRVSTMVSGEMTHSDTAYTALALGAHTDLSYFTVPAGIQVFHCLEHEGEGGLTLLVDGFHAAQELRRIEPASFQCLVTTPVPHEYIEGTHYHLYSLGTVLATHPLSGQLTHIRFNPYDRAPLKTVSADSMAQFYSSYEALTRIIRNKSSEFWLKLNPGMVLLVDNWRVMHGRSSFTGRRVLCSAYLPRDDWMSRARVLGSLLERTEKKYFNGEIQVKLPEVVLFKGHLCMYDLFAAC
ncbi:hypothetical protein ACOMHN_018269 [Nucella lapillus]